MTLFKVIGYFINTGFNSFGGCFQGLELGQLYVIAPCCKF